jgi:hypothetical protein
VEKASTGRFQKYIKNQAAILEEIQGLIVPHYTQRLKKQCKFKVKLDDYWTNLHKKLSSRT